MNLKFTLLLILFSSVIYSQEIGINTDNPQAQFHLTGINTEVVNVDFENQSSHPLLIANGTWYYNGVAYEGNFSTNSGYLPMGYSLMNYNIVVPADSFAILEYAIKVDVFNSGLYRLPFEDSIFGPQNQDWEIKTVKLDTGTHLANWLVSHNGGNLPAGLIYVDNVKVTFFSKSPLLRIEDCLQEDGKVLTSDANGNASWRHIPLAQLTDEDKDTKILVEQNLDDDKIRFILKGKEQWKMDSFRLEPTNNDNSILIGLNAGRFHDFNSKDGIIAIGDSVLFNNRKNTSFDFLGSKNIGIGNRALMNNVLGHSNIAIGQASLKENIEGFRNCAIGIEALSNNTSGFNNVGMGTFSLLSNTEGSNNLAVGYESMSSNKTASFNTALGNRAMMQKVSGDENVAVGNYALNKNLDGAFNVAVGGRALELSQIQSGLVAIGYRALQKNGEGLPSASEAIENTAIGTFSMESNTTGSFNVSVGYESLKSNYIGDENSAFGTRALYSNTEGDKNLALGTNALFNNTIGARNNAVGNASLYNNTTGVENIGIGNSALFNNETGNGNLAIGNAALFNNIRSEGLIAIGDSVLFKNGTGALFGEDGFYNIGVGRKALFNNLLGSSNIAIGRESLFDNTSGIFNIAIGSKSLFQNVDGNNNIAIGRESLFLSRIGDNNVAIGKLSMHNNYSGSGNVALGTNSLNNNASGRDNVAVGRASMSGNDAGKRNVAVGLQALSKNTDADENCALGHAALLENTIGHSNVAVGSLALRNMSAGNFNTAVGYVTMNTLLNLENATAVGYKATVSENNQIRIGNTSCDDIGGYEMWSDLSDRRFKRNIKESTLGLSFIKDLRPVTYNLDIHALEDWNNRSTGAQKRVNWKGKYDKEKQLKTGFIAQEVEAAALSHGVNFSGVVTPKSEHSHYSLRYAAFTVPLVTAVQELAIENNVLKEELELQAEKIKYLSIQIEKENEFATHQSEQLKIQGTLLLQLSQKFEDLSAKIESPE